MNRITGVLAILLLATAAYGDGDQTSAMYLARNSKL